MTTRLVGDRVPDKDPSLGDTSFDNKEKLRLPSDVLPLASRQDTRKSSGITSLWYSWKRPAQDLDAIATQRSVFDDPVTLEIYRPPSQFENTHRFDPDARWTHREERGIVRKIDFRIALWACIMFFALDLDRSNILQANSDNFLPDLHMTTNDYNLGNTLFKLSFMIAEVPSQLLSKRIGPDVWIPAQMCLWSIVSFSQFWLSGRSSFLACRCLLGFLQGGFIPDAVLYLSYFYTNTELPMRLAWFYVSNSMSHILSACLATGILRLRGVGGRSGWRYLFLFEGLFTLVIGVASWFLMPPGPTQTRRWSSPKGWFSEREEVILVNRVLRDDPSKSSMHNRQGLSVRMIIEVFLDWRLWPLYILGLTYMIPVGAPQQYLTLSLRNLGFSTTQTNLLTIPSNVLGLITLLLTSLFSEAVDSRVGAAIILQLWALPLLIALYTFNYQTSHWVYFIVVSLITGSPSVQPIQVAWVSRNSYSVRTRAVSASIYNMLVQADIMIYSNTYTDDDKPLYKRGNRALIGICAMNLVLYILTYVFYKKLNSRRERIWSSWTVKQQHEYLETTKDEGNKRMDFRFVY